MRRGLSVSPRESCAAPFPQVELGQEWLALLKALYAASGDLVGNDADPMQLRTHLPRP
jgi:hypothetical protein